MDRYNLVDQPEQLEALVGSWARGTFRTDSECCKLGASMLGFNRPEYHHRYQLDEYSDVTTPTPQPSWIDVLAFDVGSSNGLSTDAFIQHLSGRISHEEFKASRVVEAAWKVSLVISVV